MCRKHYSPSLTAQLRETQLILLIILREDNRGLSFLLCTPPIPPREQLGSSQPKARQGGRGTHLAG